LTTWNGGSSISSARLVLADPEGRAIREAFGFSTTRLPQLLHRAVDRPGCARL
jgi:hypothetical protein